MICFEILFVMCNQLSINLEFEKILVGLVVFCFVGVFLVVVFFFNIINSEVVVS